MLMSRFSAAFAAFRSVPEEPKPATRDEFVGLFQRVEKLERWAWGKSSSSTLYCSFCGKSQHEVRMLVAGKSSYICDQCIDLSKVIISEGAA